MTLFGKVTRKYEEGGDFLIEVDIQGDNNMGPHVTGSAVMALPSKG
jgi:hypothetical protein